MALHTATGDNIPEKCIGLTKKDAVQFQMSIMESLSSYKNRVFTSYGPYIAGFSSGVTSILIVNSAIHISGISRNFKFSMLLPFIIGPALVTAGLHKTYIRNDIVIQKWACPVCYHLKSAFFQVFFGAVYPALFGGYYAFATARKSRLPGIPPLNYRKEIIKCVREKVQPVKTKLKIISVVNILIGIALAEFESNEINNFNLNFEKLATEYNRKFNESIKDKA